MQYTATRLGIKNPGPRVFRPVFLGAAAFSAVSACLLLAADSPWIAKPAAQWTAEDAQQVLSASPWAKLIRADVARRETEEQLRDGGVLGQPTGLGYEGVDPKGSGYTPSLNIFTGKGGDDRSVRSMARPGALPLGLRWESALPVRLAKLKSGTGEPEPLDGEGYQIGVYGVPNPDSAKGDPKQLGEPLKKQAVLRRVGQKDVRPTRVEVFPRDGGPVIIYQFPATSEITNRDGTVLFEAHIGRIVISQGFDLRQMQFMGKLAL